ncbi:dTDP-4-dehydrorhamnose reductase [Nonlabens ponticola]|uniref:dTDP-4-dehydrorhamnose reductase n=1 Tax=Nonlabens ponticola TaxID=2496866 RepID=A0A3S9MVH0_9FLAO|nr:dTDP-4-dehydrorhamnose reductase [Nonlabens ponticola]AZQ43127.1 dTDP-4-dehydrorhamnose reductase [Nonlabens ponticola]
MKKILLAGANGMLGISMQQALVDHDLIALGSDELDISCTRDITAAIIRYRPNYFINCAAYTAVDLAETEVEKAYKINATAVRQLAQICEHHRVTLIHFSTDYVFDGNATLPYRPHDAVRPINVYGASKLLGEQYIQDNMSSFYIFRISWLYAAHGKNFMRWVLENNLEEMHVVDNQLGSPTSADSVALFINHLVENDPDEHGVYHYTNQGELTWYAFAKAISQKSNVPKNIHPTSSFKTAASRPSYSVMNTDAIRRTFNYDIPTIDTALEEVLERYKSRS